MSDKAILAITAGEPAGIGPDLCLQVFNNTRDADLVFFADPQLLTQRADTLGLNVAVNEVLVNKLPAQMRPGMLNVVASKMPAPATPGHLDKNNSAYVLDTLDKAVSACKQSYCDAMVTAPVHKGIINDAGFMFSGHTEFIAEKINADPVMMLACPGLRVALATTHLPLRDVSDAITTDSLKTLLHNIHHDLQTRFGISKPVIYVCGLNPHAGEGGHLGREEIEIIGPALEALREQHGMELIGPLSADTLFTPKYLEHADAVLAMFHDQGLPVLKHMGFGNAVNITLGLPIIRTSVDHGTALDLAGTGRADTGSMQQAIVTAVEMVANSRSKAQ